MWCHLTFPWSCQICPLFMTGENVNPVFHNTAMALVPLSTTVQDLQVPVGRPAPFPYLACRLDGQNQSVVDCKSTYTTITSHAMQQVRPQPHLLLLNGKCNPNQGPWHQNCRVLVHSWLELWVWSFVPFSLRKTRRNVQDWVWQEESRKIIRVIDAGRGSQRVLTQRFLVVGWDSYAFHNRIFALTMLIIFLRKFSRYFFASI